MFKCVKWLFVPADFYFCIFQHSVKFPEFVFSTKIYFLVVENMDMGKGI